MNIGAEWLDVGLSGSVHHFEASCPENIPDLPGLELLNGGFIPSRIEKGSGGIEKDGIPQVQGNVNARPIRSKQELARAGPLHEPA